MEPHGVFGEQFAQKIVRKVSKRVDQGVDRIVQHPIGGTTLLTLANLTTIIRIFISPVFLLVYLEYEWLGIAFTTLPYVLLGLLMALEMSDVLDGYIARRYDQVTDLGKILDPMADSISRISIYLTFTQPPVRLPLLLVFIFIYRDSIISTLRTVCAFRGFALAARSSGKIKAVIQAICALSITALLIPYSQGVLGETALRQLSCAIASVAASYSLYAGCEYLVVNRKYVYQALKKRTRRSMFVEE